MRAMLGWASGNTGRKLMAANHTIHSGNHRHLAWDNSTPPAMTIAPGDVVQFDDLDATSGQLTADSTVEDIRTLDFSLVNPIAGPVYVDGAEPGDALKVTLMEFQPNTWAWTAIVPGFGLLADDFPEPALNIWSYEGGFDTPAMYGDDARVPMKPFCGTIGVVQAEAGAFSTIPPSDSGGNMDIRDLSAGAELYLPVRPAGSASRRSPAGARPAGGSPRPGIPRRRSAPTRGPSACP